MKRLFLFIMISIFCHSLFAAPAQTIRFATEATYPPFEYINDEGSIKGFDIDLAKALCQQMKAECTFSNQSFNSLIPSLKLGRFDAIISALGVTPERLQQVAFSNSYYEPSGCFIAASAKHYTLANIPGKTIGVQIGSTFENYVLNKYENKVTVKTYASIQDAFLDLVAGRIDIVMADTPIAQEWLKENDNSKQFSIVEKPISDHTYFGTGYGIAVRKDNTALLAAFNQALAEIKTNGTYAKLTKEYFGN